MRHMANLASFRVSNEDSVWLVPSAMSGPGVLEIRLDGYESEEGRGYECQQGMGVSCGW